MKEISVSVPDEVFELVEKTGNPGEYLRALVYSDLLTREGDRLDSLLLEGLESGEPIELDDPYWERKKANLIARHALEEHAS